MCILSLSKVLMYEFHYEYIKNKCGNISRFTNTDNLINEIKTEDFSEDFSKDKKCVILVIIQLSQTIMMIQTN